MNNVKSVQMMLKWAFALVPILAGLDKLLQLNLLTEWAGYLAPVVPETLGISAVTIMSVIGIVEILAGVLVLVSTRIGAWIVAIWMFLIAINLLVAGFYDVAVRDVVLGLSAASLAMLTPEKKK